MREEEEMQVMLRWAWGSASCTCVSIALDFRSELLPSVRGEALSLCCRHADLWNAFDCIVRFPGMAIAALRILGSIVTCRACA